MDDLGIGMSKLGIVFALDAEEAGLRRVLAESRTLVTNGASREIWRVGGVEELVEVSGVGRERCEAATHTLIRNGARQIIAAGFATALSGSLRPGDVIVASRVLLCNGNQVDPLTCDEELLRAVPPNGWQGYAVRHADLVTTDGVVLTPEDRGRIYRACGAAALDMESYAAAQVCLRLEIPFLAVRGISDSAEQTLPKEIETLAAMRGMLRQAIYVLARPHIWRSIMRLRSQSNAAADNLADVIGTILLRLI